MITIFEVSEMDSFEGKSIAATYYFSDKEDADNHYKQGAQYRTKPHLLQVFEKGEFTVEKVKIQHALSKLTDEEKQLLGLDAKFAETHQPACKHADRKFDPQNGLVMCTICGKYL